MINLSKKLRNNIKIIFWFLLITGLIAGPFLFRNPSGESEKMMPNTILIFFLIVIHLGFFLWLVCQFFDFEKRKFINPSPGSKLVMFFYFMLMGAGGAKEGDELIPTIAVSILILGLTVQIVVGIAAIVRKTRDKFKN